MVEHTFGGTRLGFDTTKLTISLPCRKSSKLRQVLAGWPYSRHFATFKQIAELMGFLLHVCVGGHTPGEVFVQRLLAHANMPLSSAACFLSSSERPRRLVPLDPEFYGDLEFCRWIVEAGIDESEGGLSVPMYCLVARPPCHTLTSDASKLAVGGFYLETGQQWWDGSSEEELARFCGSMVRGDRPVGDRDCVLLRGRNEAAVHWVRRCRGGKEPHRGLSCVQ